jgi:translation initiation factor IF-1
MSGEAITLVGTVVAESRGDLYEVEVQAGAARRRVLAKRSGRLVVHRIKIVAGDTVTVEVSPYDLTRGRITYRGVRAPREPTDPAT